MMSFMQATQQPSMIPADTSLDAARVYYARLAAMTIEQRFARMTQFMQFVRDLARAAIRERHPRYTEEQVRRAFLRRQLGAALYREVFPDEDDAD